VPLNRQAAVAYALKYALSFNPAYRRNTENDCTNFVSQSLLEGGWTMAGGNPDGSDRKSDSVWWYGKRTGWYFGENWSWTWANAASFSRFLAVSGRAVRVTDPGQLDPADVIQMASGGHVHHSMIVTEKGAGGLKVSYHSSPERNIPLADVRARAPDETFLYWKLSNTNS